MGEFRIGTYHRTKHNIEIKKKALDYWSHFRDRERDAGIANKKIVSEEYLLHDSLQS